MVIGFADFDADCFALDPFVDAFDPFDPDLAAEPLDLAETGAGFGFGLCTGSLKEEEDEDFDT